MQYRKMAQRFLFERGANAVPDHDDGEDYTPEGRAFTRAQLLKFAEALAAEREVARARLVANGAIQDG